MPNHIHATHRIVIEAPIERCFMFFTPAGEELWVDGWQPSYVHPAEQALDAFEGDRFAAMIDGWAAQITACRARLMQATIR